LEYIKVHINKENILKTTFISAKNFFNIIQESLGERGSIILFDCTIGCTQEVLFLDVQ
jgi:hypothetical protein